MSTYFMEKRMPSLNFYNHLFVFFLIFCFIFSPKLDFGLIIHTGLLSLTMLLMLSIARKRNFYSLSKSLVVVAIFFLFLAVYSFTLSFIYENDSIDFIRICISVILSVIFGWFLASYLVIHGTDTCNLLDRLIMMCTIAAVLNSSVVLAGFALPEIKSIIESFLSQNTDGLIYAEHPFQLRGLASAGGAALSVFNAIAILFIIYLIVNKRIVDSIAMLGAFIITCSNVFTGRTGLIPSLIFTFTLLIIVCVKNFRSGLFGVVRVIATTIVFLFILRLLTNYELESEVFLWAFEWVNGISSGKIETASSDDLKTMIFLPDNPIHLMFGIGFFEGVGKIYPRSDSGYIKTILSVGVPLSVILYSSIIFMFFQVTKISSKYFWLVISVLAVMMVVEVKEPIFYQNFSARLILMFSGAAMFILVRRRAKGSNKG